MSTEKERIRILPPAGVYTANWIPYGYQYDPESTALVKIDVEAADHVRYIFRKYIEGMPLQEICRQLDEQGVPNPTIRKEQLGAKSRSKKMMGHWSAVSMSQMFFNPMYVGDWMQSGKLWNAVYLYSGEPAPDGRSLPVIEENHHEALISKEDMKQASLLFLKNRAERDAKQKRKKYRNTPNLTDPLGQRMRCSECGRTMVKSELLVGDGSRLTVYSCASFFLHQSCSCASYFYRLNDLSAAVVPLLVSERKEAIKYRKMIETEKDSSYARIERSLQREIDQAVDSVRRNLTAGQKLNARARSNKITEEELQNSQAQLDVENRAAEQQVMQALLQLRSFRSSCTIDNPWLALYSDLPERIDLTDDPEPAVRAVDRIDCSPDQPPAISLLYMDEKEAFQQVFASPTRSKRTASGKSSIKRAAHKSSSDDKADFSEGSNALDAKKES